MRLSHICLNISSLLPSHSHALARQHPCVHRVEHLVLNLALHLFIQMNKNFSLYLIISLLLSSAQVLHQMFTITFFKTRPPLIFVPKWTMRCPHPANFPVVFTLINQGKPSGNNYNLVLKYMNLLICWSEIKMQYIQSVKETQVFPDNPPPPLFLNPELPKGSCVYERAKKLISIVGRWTETCDFCFYLCDVGGARVNEPQQIARKDIITSAHAPPASKQRLHFSLQSKKSGTNSFFHNYPHIDCTWCAYLTLYLYMIIR